MRQLFILVIFVGLLSCSKRSETKSNITHADSLSTDGSSSATLDTIKTPEIDYGSLLKLESYLANNVVTDSELQVVDIDCAILIYPTHEQIEEMKKTEGEENFYTGADDSNWYLAMAIEKIDSFGIKKVSASGQYLRLKGQNGAWNLDIRKKNLPAWNLIFFKRTKEPQIMSTVDLTAEEVREYFEIAEKKANCQQAIKHMLYCRLLNFVTNVGQRRSI